MSDDQMAPDRPRIHDPDGDLLERASREGTYRLIVREDGVNTNREKLEWEFLSEPLEAEGRDEEQASPGEEPGRPRRRRVRATETMTVRLTPAEQGVLEAASEEARSAFAREAILARALQIAQDPRTCEARRERILEALRAYEQEGKP